MAANESPALDDHLAWLALTGLPHIGGRRCRRLIEGFGSVRAALEAPPASWEEVIGAAGRRARSVPVPWQWAASQLEALQRCDGQLLTLEDPRYPHLLAETAAPPPVLFVLGTLPQDLPCLALVGTRRASHSGRRMAHQLALDLVAAGFCVVSGMAWGIDASAHEGAPRRGWTNPGGSWMWRRRSLSSEPCRSLQSNPAAGRGCLGIPHGQWRYCRLVPAAQPGDQRALPGDHRGRGAGAQRRPDNRVLCPGAEPRGLCRSRGRAQGQQPGWCHQLLREGAKLVEGVEDVMEELGHWGMSPRSAPVAEAALSGAEGKVFDRLSADPCHVDDLAHGVEMEPARLLDVLLRLELQGRVEQLPGKHFVRRAL